MRDSRHITKEEGRKDALLHLDTILTFVESINRAKPQIGFQPFVISLLTLRERIEKSSPPLRSASDVKSYLRPVQDGIIRFLPPVRNQLDDFWQVQNLIIQASNKAKTSYSPAEVLDKKYEAIEVMQKRFDIVLERFVANPNDEVNIDALFYIHILRTETLAKGLIEQLSELIKKFNISGFDAASIYSIQPPIKQVYRGSTRYLTDAEAVRNALAHNKYKITFDKHSWRIEMDNNNEFGYHYKKSFTQKEFEEYLKQTEILYRASVVLIYMLVLWGIITNLLLEKQS
jgi:hypothetical protein